VALFNTDFYRFFAVSLTLHLLALLLLYAPRPAPSPRQEAIPVSVLPAPEKTVSESSTLTRIPRAAPTRPTKTPAVVARKDSPAMPQILPADPGRATKPQDYRDETHPPLAAPTPAPREPTEQNIVIAERQLPTMKDLLPPPGWSSSGSRAGAPVSLNTRDPVYVSYFNKIKQSIELQWEYPEVALRYGLQGRLSLEFAIAANGQLERLRILRSSGSQVLDDEAMRAIKAAAPFPPIPPWIKATLYRFQRRWSITTTD
jgi:periplasmic protein TonB